MTKFTDNIRKIAKTTELNAKIPIIPFLDKTGIASKRGEGFPINTPPVCALSYFTSDNAYDIGALLAGTDGPTLGDKCTRVDTITGLTDFDVSAAPASFGAVVYLVLQPDGVFT